MSVLASNGSYAVLVPDSLQVGDYRDYSIKALQDAGIPLKEVPRQEMSVDDVSIQLNELSKAISYLKSNK